MIFSIPGDFLGFLSRICKGISDLYGFILYTFAISDRSVFKLSRVTWIHVNTCKLGFLSIPWRWFSRFCFRIIWIYFVYHGDSWSSFIWEIAEGDGIDLLLYCVCLLWKSFPFKIMITFSASVKSLLIIILFWFHFFYPSTWSCPLFNFFMDFVSLQIF